VTFREIRSYVIREGRMSPGQRRALIEYWPQYGLNLADGKVDPVRIFTNDHPLVLEIGFGMGDSLLEMAAAEPATNFIGIEVHRPGVGHLLINASEAGLTNLRVFNADSKDVVEQCIVDACLDRIQVFFPDPWHKKRHHKRRLIALPFVQLLREKLKPNGVLHIATDWTPYAEKIRETLRHIPAMQPVTPPARPVTKYERRGVALGHDVTDLAYQRTD
jgi:tRNA (guanine-N7-)-methyltransferase